VWRHIVNCRQDLLDQFINCRKSFRGVFLENTTRRYGPELTAAATAEAEKQKEKQMLESVKEGSDHPDFFVIPAVFGMERLHQEQCARLAKDHCLRLENTDLAPKKRNVSARIWTLMPSVSYPDMVALINKQDADRVKWPNALLKTLYRGLTCVNDPLPPLHMLLSPTTLANEEFAKDAIYAISSVSQYTQADTFLAILRTVLGERRRKQLKITHHKEIIRLISTKPGQQSLDLITAELTREGLHRDVRIAANSVLSRYLFDDSLREKAWSFLVASGKRSSADELLVLMAAMPETEAGTRVSFSNVIITPQMSEQCAELTGKVLIPTSFSHRYALEIVLPMVTQPKLKEEKKLEDFRTLAALCLYNWREFLDHNVIAESLKNLLSQTEPAKLEKYRTHVNVYDQMVGLSVRYLYHICGVTSVHGSSEGKANKEHINAVFQTLCQGITRPIQDGDIFFRTQLIKTVKIMVNTIPTSNTRFPDEVANVFLAPVRGLAHIFDECLLGYDINKSLAPGTKDWLPTSVRIFQEIFNRSKTGPTRGLVLLVLKISAEEAPQFLNAILNLKYEEKDKALFYRLVLDVLQKKMGGLRYDSQLPELVNFLEKIPLERGGAVEYGSHLVSLCRIMSTIPSGSQLGNDVLDRFTKLAETNDEYFPIAVHLYETASSKILDLDESTLLTFIATLFKYGEISHHHADLASSALRLINTALAEERFDNMRRNITREFVSGEIAKRVGGLDKMSLPSYLSCALGFIQAAKNTADASRATDVSSLVLQVAVYSALHTEWYFEHAVEIRKMVQDAFRSKHGTVNVNYNVKYCEDLLNRDVSKIPRDIIGDVISTEQINAACKSPIFLQLRVDLVIAQLDAFGTTPTSAGAKQVDPAFKSVWMQLVNMDDGEVIQKITALNVIGIGATAATTAASTEEPMEVTDDASDWGDASGWDAEPTSTQRGPRPARPRNNRA